MKYVWTILGLFALVASMLTGRAVAAQPTPQSGALDSELRAALAAIAPDANDLPVGYDFVGESFLSAQELMGEDAATLTDAGFITMYVSVYANDVDQTRIRSFASAWTDAEAASAGSELLNQVDGELEAGPADIGDEPRETTSGSYEADGTTMNVESISFRHESMLLGTAVETSNGSAPDAGLAQDIGQVMLDRAETVSEGSSPKNTDLALTSRTLELGSEGDLIQAGFLGPKEVEAIYDTQGSVLSKLQASWVETVAVGEGSDMGTITVGLTAFGSAEDAGSAVTQSADIFPPLTDQKAAEDANVDGADQVAAYTYSSSSDEQDALDSYRIVFSVDANLVVIDVQGAPSSDTATSTANDLATAQMGCVAGDTCQVPDLSAMEK